MFTTFLKLHVCNTMICLYEKELQVMCNKINWNILSHMTIIFFSEKKNTRENIKTKGNYQIH